MEVGNGGEYVLIVSG